MNSLFENSRLESTPSGTVDIFRIYNEKYLPGKNALIEKGEFTQTMYNFMVKGKTVSGFVKAGIKDDMTKGKVCGVWEINVTKNPALTDLTLRRLYACLTFDNAFLGTGPGVQDYTPVRAETAATIVKFIPSMSTSIDWGHLCSLLSNNDVKIALNNKVQFSITPGIQYVYRIWKGTAQRSDDENKVMLTAMAIGSLCQDMSRHHSLMKNNPSIIVNTRLTASVAMEERGSLAAFFICSAGASGMTMDLVKSKIITAEMDSFVNSEMTCSSPSKGKQAVRDTLARYLPADGQVHGREELLRALKIRLS